MSLRERYVSKAVELTRADHSAEEFRREASRCGDADAARRMLALAMVRDGASRADASRLCGMDRQTLRDWVLRYNAQGLPGLFDSKQTRRGPKPKLSAVQRQELAEIVRQGPDVAEHGVVRWRRTDLAGVISQRFGVTLAARTVGAVLRSLGFRRLSARPQHPKQDPEAMETYKKTSPIWSPPASPRRRAASRLKSGFRMKPASASKAA
jgi:transposase